MNDARASGPAPAGAPAPGDAGRAALHRGAALVSCSPDPIIGLTLEGVITDWNPAAQRLYGYGAEEVIGASIRLLVPPELRDRPSLLVQVAAGGTVTQLDTQRMTKDGRRIDVSISLSPITDDDGTIVGAAAFTRDLRPRAEADEQLRRSQARLAEAQEVASLGAWEWDVLTNEVTWSAVLFRILGLDPERFAPTYDGYFGRVHPDDRPELERLVHEVVATGRSLFHVTRILRADDGVERITESRGEAITDASGNVVRLVGTSQDITEFLEVRRRLDKVSRHNETLLNTAGEGIVGIDADGLITFANPAATRMTGFAAEELVGQSTHAMTHHARSEGTLPFGQDPVSASLRDGTVQHDDGGVYYRKDGSSFPVEYTITPIEDEDEVSGVVVVFKDISERREVRRAKDEFVSIVSHELRTPLTSIRGSLGLLTGGALKDSPAKAQRMLQIALENTERLVRLVNDILDVERLESGAVALERHACDAAQLVREAAETIRAAAVQAGVTLHVSGGSAIVRVDRDRILQTLTNLLSNAIKFSTEGDGVWVQCEARDDAVIFGVRDEGRGIPAAKLERIFEPFQQVDSSDTRGEGGTGLGLAICRSIVERHGGQMWVESVLGAGSTFRFTLPATPSDSLDATAATPAGRARTADPDP